MLKEYREAEQKHIGYSRLRESDVLRAFVFLLRIGYARTSGRPKSRAFVDFILSAPAQRMMQSAEYFPSNPDVELSPNLKMIVPRNAGIPELLLTSERLGELTPQSVALYQRYFR